MENLPRANEVAQDAPLARTVTDALRLSRQISQLNPHDYALQLRMLLRREVTEEEVNEGEAGAVCPAADYLVAAGRICTTALSILVGEWEYDAERIDELAASVIQIARSQ